MGWFNGRCMRQQVEETIEVIRPALQADGGDIVLRGVDESTGIVTRHARRRLRDLPRVRRRR